MAHELGHWSAIGTSFFGDENRTFAIGEAYADDHRHGSFSNINQILGAASYGGSQNHNIKTWLANSSKNKQNTNQA